MDELKFFTKYGGEGQDKPAVEELANEAIRRGYDISFTDDFSEQAEIGVYPRVRGESNADKSVIMFHGIDDAYRENYWLTTGHDWSGFDIGFLPNKVAVESWKEQSYHPQANPKVGMFEAGWPKSDRVTSNLFRDTVNQLREELQLSDGRTVLYAPTSEGSGKVDQFVEKVDGVADNLLIKHAPYESLTYCGKYDTLGELYTQFESRDDIHILDPQEDILVCLALSDILVTDQSSVLVEALLNDTVPVSVTDWPVRSGATVSEKEFQASFVTNTKLDALSNTVQSIYEQYEMHLENMGQERTNHYSHFGNSSEICMDIIEAVASGEDPPVNPLEPTDTLPIHSSLYTIRRGIVNRIPEHVKKYLVRLRVHKALDRFEQSVAKYLN